MRVDPCTSLWKIQRKNDFTKVICPRIPFYRHHFLIPATLTAANLRILTNLPQETYQFSKPTDAAAYAASRGD